MKGKRFPVSTLVVILLLTLVAWDRARAYHNSDCNPSDWKISLSELLRGIQFYNIGGYACDAGSEDGYVPGGGDRTCTPHASDYNPQDWKVGLTELLRLIQFYNSGGYHPDATGEDGYAPGVYSSPASAWAKSYSLGGIDELQSVKQTSDGGYVSAGYAASPYTYSYAYRVTKASATGNVEWEKLYNGQGDFATDILPTDDGGYIVVGFSWSYGTSGSQDAWVLKLDANGVPLWQRSYGAAASAQRPYAVILAHDGGYVLTGEWSKPDGSDIWVVKLDAVGNIQWQKAYGGGQEEGYSIQATSDGGYIVVGYWEMEDILPNAWILKLDSAGNVAWQRDYGDFYVLDRVNSILETAGGTYLVAGVTHSYGAGGADAWVMELDTDGSVLWQKAYGGALDDQAKAIQATSDGAYVVTGTTESFGAGGSDAWVLKLSADGTVLWQRAYGGTGGERTTSIQETSHGGYIVGVVSENRGWILLKLDSNGLVNFNNASAMAATDTTASGIEGSVDLGVTSSKPWSTFARTRSVTCAVTNTICSVEQLAP